MTALRRLVHRVRAAASALSEFGGEYEAVWTVRRAHPTAHIEPSVQIKGDLTNLELGEDVVIQARTVLHLGGMAWSRFDGRLLIGDRSQVGPLCVLFCAGPGGITIGSDSELAPGVLVFSSRVTYDDGPRAHVFRPVTIGDRVIVNANTVISPGVTVGDGAVIAAGAVVVLDVPPNTMVGGVPARPIRTLGPPYVDRGRS